MGYTGHVPRVRETFAVNNKVASNAIYEKSSGIGSMTRLPPPSHCYLDM